VIRATGLTKTFQNFVAVDHIDLNVPQGIVFAFLGPNGAGKTTTIRILTGILEPDSGKLEMFGTDYASRRSHILNRIGFIPDRPFLYGKLSAMELLRFLGSLRRLDGSFVKKKSLEMLEEFKLIDFRNELIERFSHGMKQKLVMISALLHDPDLLIVDEPMVGLDPRAALQVKRLILDFAKKGKTVFMSTHTLDVAAQLCDRVGIIHKGQIVANETLPNLTKRLEAQDGDLEAVFLALTEDQEPEAIPIDP